MPSQHPGVTKRRNRKPTCLRSSERVLGGIFGATVSDTSHSEREKQVRFLSPRLTSGGGRLDQAPNVSETTLNSEMLFWIWPNLVGLQLWELAVAGSNPAIQT